MNEHDFEIAQRLTLVAMKIWPHFHIWERLWDIATHCTFLHDDKKRQHTLYLKRLNKLKLVSRISFALRMFLYIQGKCEHSKTAPLQQVTIWPTPAKPYNKELGTFMDFHVQRKGKHSMLKNWCWSIYFSSHYWLRNLCKFTYSQSQPFLMSLNVNNSRRTVVKTIFEVSTKSQHKCMEHPCKSCWKSSPSRQNLFLVWKYSW